MKIGFKSTIISTLIFSLYLASCNKYKKEGYETRFSKFADKQEVSFKNFMPLDTTIGNDRIFLLDTSLILVNQSKLKKNYLFFEYSKKSKELLGRFIKWGTGKYMAYGPMSAGLYKGEKLWLHDLVLEKVITISDRYSDDTLNNIQEYSMPGFTYSAQLYNDNMLLQSGLYSVPEYLQISEIATNNPVKQIGKFIPPNDEFPLMAQKAGYEGFLFLKPDEKKAVLSCRYSDRITLFDFSKDSIKVVCGPENFEAQFVPVPNKRVNNYSIRRTAKTTFAFLGGAVTNQFVYLLFSGKRADEGNVNISKTVFVYDWDGNPVKELSLDREVKAIAVTGDDNQLFAIDPLRQMVVVSDLRK